ASQESAKTGVARPSSPPPAPPRTATASAANRQTRHTVSFSEQVLVSTFGDGPGPGTLTTEHLRGDHGEVGQGHTSSSKQADNARSGSNAAGKRDSVLQGKHVSSLMRELSNNTPEKGAGR
ncbi:MAG: hypothetical protein ACTJLK_00255, partial [Anaplasma sp.]